MERTTGGAQSQQGGDVCHHFDKYMLIRKSDQMINVHDHHQMGQSEEEQKGRMGDEVRN